MKFKSISARNKITGWNVENIQFNPMLTLLVGASGVGKTKVLNVIKTLVRIADGDSFNGLEWKVEFEQNGHAYVWEGAFEVSSDVYKVQLLDKENNKFSIETEVVKEIIGDKESVIVNRTSDKIIYNGNEVVKLDKTQSVVELLKEESAIKPIYNGFKQCSSFDASELSPNISPVSYIEDKKKLSLLQIKQNKNYSLLDKFILLGDNRYDEFNVICHKFEEIFPNVKQMGYSVRVLNNGQSVYVIEISEYNVNSWIPQYEISAGMMRTLLQIIALVLANDGDVIMIDEFENGLGVNCINELADLIMEPDADIQVVMTSHHPYIINTIPVKDWKILTRNGCDVQVHTAEELRIGEHSKHEAFMQLLQTPEYKTGINRN